jgi:C_GCAxxG_C_C family probable redox protein
MTKTNQVSEINPQEMAMEARELFSQHYNCAQSAFGPFARLVGMDPELAFKIATPFGGGMGHAGQICGAVSGGLMAIGLVRGISVYDQEVKYACYDLARQFQDRFQAIHGELTCPGLLGYHIGDPRELAQVREQGLFHSLCPQLVGDAARITAELLTAGS